jgi:hypothetical protein
MALSDIRAGHVRRALAECNRLGEAAFLARYDFAPSRSFLLLAGGRFYQSKAIVGAAHGYATGLPLSSHDFSGGEATVKRLLEKLGFTVRQQGFDSWTFWDAMHGHEDKLTARLSPWVSWSRRGELEDLAYPGVYVIGTFGRRPSAVVPLARGIVYVGQTRRTLRQRLDEFEMAVKGASGHSGGHAYRSRVGHTLVRAFVAVLPVRLPGWQTAAAIGLLEQYLLWAYTTRWRTAPRCNSK